MSKFRIRMIAVAGSVLGAAAMVSGANAAEMSKAVQILFETPHISPLTPGSELVYKFERKPSDEKVLGMGFKDDIKVKVEKDQKDGKKDVVVQIYSGARARDPYPIENMSGNPMVAVYLENAVAHFREIAGGDATYLKNTFSRKIGSDAKVSDATVTYKGEAVPGQTITIKPYVEDAARSKMRGYEGATFTITVSDKVPGHLAKMVSSFPNTSKDGATLEETTTLDGVGEVK